MASWVCVSLELTTDSRIFRLIVTNTFDAEEQALNVVNEFTQMRMNHEIANSGGVMHTVPLAGRMGKHIYVLL